MAHRIFKQKPPALFEEGVRDYVRQTGRPEDHPDLYHDRIAKNEPFIKLCPIDLDAKQRPEGDRVDCPMCQPNKFLSGFLCWFPEKQFCAVIGHCCADSETAAAADREYRIRTERTFEEDYLLAALPLVVAKQQALAALRPAAEEARRLFCKLRAAKPVHAVLREIAREGGRLTLQEEISEEARMGDSPAGVRRSRQSIFRTIDLGTMSGPTVTLTEYQPIKRLDLMAGTLASYEVGEGEEAALDFICTYGEERAKRHAAVVLLQSTDDQFRKFIAKLKDFVSFFEPDNLRRLAEWGTHPANPYYLQVSQRAVAGQPRVEISSRGELVALSPRPTLWPPAVDWPVPSVKKR